MGLDIMLSSRFCHTIATSKRIPISFDLSRTYSTEELLGEAPWKYGSSPQWIEILNSTGKVECREDCFDHNTPFYFAALG